MPYNRYHHLSRIYPCMTYNTCMPPFWQNSTIYEAQYSLRPHDVQNIPACHINCSLMQCRHSQGWPLSTFSTKQHRTLLQNSRHAMYRGVLNHLVNLLKRRRKIFPDQQKSKLFSFSLFKSTGVRCSSRRIILEKVVFQMRCLELEIASTRLQTSQIIIEMLRKMRSIASLKGMVTR